MGRDNNRGRTSLDQTHLEFRGQLQPLLRVPQCYLMLKSRARRSRAGATRQGADYLRDRRQDTRAYVVGQALRRIRAGHAIPGLTSWRKGTELEQDVIRAQRIK